MDVKRKRSFWGCAAEEEDEEEDKVVVIRETSARPIEATHRTHTKIANNLAAPLPCLSPIIAIVLTYSMLGPKK